MRNLIKKILRENFDWTSDAPEMEIGDLFQEDDVYFGRLNNMFEVSVLDNGKVVFTLDQERFNTLILGDRDDWVLDQVIGGYSGYGDSYELDDDEINYLGDYLTDEQVDRLNNLLERLGHFEGAQSYIDGQTFRQLGDIIGTNFYKGRHDWDDFAYDSLSSMGSEITRNRWVDVSKVYEKALKDGNFTIEISSSYRRTDYEITVNFPYINSTGEKFYNLSDIIREIAESLEYLGLQDVYWEGYDTGDAYLDIRRYFDNMMEVLEERMDEIEEDEDWEKPEKPDPNQLKFDFGDEI